MEILKSGVSALYVRPLYPLLGQEVCLHVHIDPSSIEWVRATVVENDNLVRYPMTRVSSMDGYDVYKANIPVKEPSVRYWFEAQGRDGIDCYLTKFGVKDYLCTWDDGFVLKADLDVPSWTSRTICYQIYPDRFNKGDPDVGAHRGDYTFDGHEITEMQWDRVPLQYQEGFCLDFYNGDLDGIAQKAQYLRELGVGAIYLNPIGQSRTTHRYDCIDFFHVDDKLGGDEAYIRMIETLHGHGIKVITDISINHTGTDHPWFLSAQNGGSEKNYYYPNREGGFDCWYNVSTLPQLNYGSESLRRVIYEDEDSVLQKFIRPPFNQDGWRLDVATDVGNHKEERNCHKVWRDVRKAIKTINKEAYLVGEDWDDSTRYLQGDQWDATMNYVGCSRPLRRWMGEKDRFFSSHNDKKNVTRPYSARQLKEHLYHQLSALPGQMVYQQMNLIDSHDEPRMHCNKDTFDRGLYKGAVMMQFMLPGMPCIYYGDEIGIDGPLGSIENCRYPMVWDEKRWDMDLLGLYKALSRLREEYAEALSEGQWEFGFTDDEVLEFRRCSETQRVVLIMYRGERRRVVSEIHVDGMKDHLSGETVHELVLEPKTSRILVSC